MTDSIKRWISFPTSLNRQNQDREVSRFLITLHSLPTFFEPKARRKNVKKTEMERARVRERATDVESKCQHLSDGPKYKVDHSVATASVPLYVSSVP